MQPGSQVELPAGIAGPLEVFVNGVPQRAGVDYAQHGTTLVFARSLAVEGRLGFWRWASMLIGVAGTYRRNEPVDVVYTHAGRRTVLTLHPTGVAADGD